LLFTRLLDYVEEHRDDFALPDEDAIATINRTKGR